MAHYVGNNPINYVDPTGHYIQPAEGFQYDGGGAPDPRDQCDDPNRTSLICESSPPEGNSLFAQVAQELYDLCTWIADGWTCEDFLTATSLIFPMTSADDVIASAAQGAEVVLGSSGNRVVLKVLTARNFRNNLKAFTKADGYGADAHHIFPQKFLKDFRRLGIEINDPKYGSWWATQDHLNNAKAYNDAWALFLKANPTKDQVLQFGRELMKLFGQTVNY